MSTEVDPVIIAIRLNTGEDLLGFFCGESYPDDGVNEPAVLVYIPLIIKMATITAYGKPISAYFTDLYFPYGDPVVAIPISKIFTRSPASPFFSDFYQRSLGELISQENSLQDSYLNFFKRNDIADIMEYSDSTYVEQHVEYKH